MGYAEKSIERDLSSRTMEFPTTLRPQVDIPVSDIDESIKFYTSLFNKRPTLVKGDTAVFNPYNPPVNLRLKQTANVRPRDGHLGVQLKSSKDIIRYKSRVELVGYTADVEETESACCFSVANKAWINDPDGHQWEIFVVTGENTTEVRCGDSCACEAEGCN
jgi:predicted lactoylglutathione lyase